MKRMYGKTAGLFLVLIIVLSLSGCAASGDMLSLPIEVKGSDTMLQMAAYLAEVYTEKYPDRRISITGGGSGTGIKALINGDIQIADASRKIKQKEVDVALENGIEPWEFIVARDGIALVVNPSNPIEGLDMGQISAVFQGTVTNWNELGGPDKPITLYGRQSTSGTYAFFMEQVVKGEYSTRMRNMEGNSQIKDSVAIDDTGIGYIGIGYIDASIKIVDVGGVNPLNEADMASGRYPLSRPLYQYTAGMPEKGGTVHEFLMFEVGPEGQEVVKKTGLAKITSPDVLHNKELFDRIGGS